MKEEMFQELSESIKEAGRIRRGEVEASRSFRHDSINIKHLRDRRCLTQTRVGEHRAKDENNDG